MVAGGWREEKHVRTWRVTQREAGARRRLLYVVGYFTYKEGKWEREKEIERERKKRIQARQHHHPILGAEVDSLFCFDRHLENRRWMPPDRWPTASPPRWRPTDHTDPAQHTPMGHLILAYKAQVSAVMECTPLTWMSSVRCHLNLPDKVLRRDKRLLLITDAYHLSH